MVSADNLNFDCLELIFACLSGNDLVSVSLVSRSFLAAVIPRLYGSLIFRLAQAKRYPAILSPFAAILRQPSLAVHVKRIDIRAIPHFKNKPQPRFMSDCARAIQLCNNLVSFTCTLDMLPSFLLSLQDKPALERLRVNANLSSDQSRLLIQIGGLRELTLDSSTWVVLDALPQWAQLLKPSLTALTLTSMQILNADILEVVLPELPLLTGLHIMHCSKVTQAAIMRLIRHTPRLESLAFTIMENASGTTIVPPAGASLPRLRHLALDTQFMIPPSQNSVPPFWTTLFNCLKVWSSPLQAISLRLSDRVSVGDIFFRELVDAHSATLARISLLNIALSHDGISLICSRCADLERLAVAVPLKEAAASSIRWSRITSRADGPGIQIPFGRALQPAKRLHSLTDVADMHNQHAQRSPMSKMDVRAIMALNPNLERIVADGRVWSAPPRKGGDPKGLHIERKALSSWYPWYMPPHSL